MMVEAVTWPINANKNINTNNLWLLDFTQTPIISANMIQQSSKITINSDQWKAVFMVETEQTILHCYMGMLIFGEII